MAIQFKSDLAKPVGRLLVDWDNPLAPRAGFIATTEPGGVVTLHARQGITRKIITNVIASPGRVAHGYGAASVSSAIAAFTLPAIAVKGATNSLTHIHIGRLSAATTSHRVWEAYNGDSTSLISAVLYSANSFQYTALPAVGGTSAVWISAAVVSPLERSSFVCTHDGVRTNNPLMWVNGQSVAVTNTAPGSGTIQAYRSNDGFFLAQRQTPQDRGWTGNIEFLYLDFVQRDVDDVLKIERNPWQLFTKPRRIWVPVSAAPGVATTPVSATLDLSWVVRSGVQQPLALSYAVKNAVQSDLGISWPVKTSAQQALSLSWLVRQSINQTLGLAYPVLNGVQQSQALAWAVKNAVQQSQALSWAVRAGVQASLAISYTVLNGVQQSQALSWTVRNAVQANLPLAYILRNAVQADLPIGYPITGTTPISRTLDLSWSVLNSGAVTSQLGLSWIVRAGVQQPLALAYPVKAGVQATLPLSWIVRAGVQQALPLAYSVLTSAQRSQALSWAVKAAAQATLPLSWIVRSGVQQPLALSYAVKNTVQTDRALGYPVLTATQSSLLLDYLVRAGVQVSFPLAYQVTGSVQRDLPLAWVVFSSQGVPELLCVSVESAYQFSDAVENAFQYEDEIAAGFPDLRVAVQKATTVCGDC